MSSINPHESPNPEPSDQSEQGVHSIREVSMTSSAKIDEQDAMSVSILYLYVVYNLIAYNIKCGGHKN